MKLKPIPSDIIVHTPTEAEAKELLGILHENGYKWHSGDCLLDVTYWDGYESKTCYRVVFDDAKTIAYSSLERARERISSTILTLAEFKRRYVVGVGDWMRINVPCDEFLSKYNGVVAHTVERQTRGDGTEGWLLGISSAYVFKDEWLEPWAGQCQDLSNKDKKAIFPGVDKPLLLCAIIGDHAYGLDDDGNLKCIAPMSEVEPYLEPELKSTEDMEPRELNLKEILKDCPAGVEFYSLLEGNVKFAGIYAHEQTDHMKPIMCSDSWYCANGAYQEKPNAACLLWPSRALYERYPLDPQTAWSKWAAEHMRYPLCFVCRKADDEEISDFGDVYFRTPADRDKCIEEIKAIIEKYSKK